MNNSYSYFPYGYLLVHSTYGTHLFINDHDQTEKNELAAQIASGDYFITLATTLDQVNEDYFSVNKQRHGALEKVIQTLTYLHQHYNIVPK